MSFFKLSMVVDGSTKKFDLLIGKGDRYVLGFDFACPAPVALWALAQTSLSPFSRHYTDAFLRAIQRSFALTRFTQRFAIILLHIETANEERDSFGSKLRLLCPQLAALSKAGMHVPEKGRC
jgi:hypothetical protein